MAFFSAPARPAYRPLPWHIVGAVDLSRDNRTDLIWRNKSTGQNDVTVMNNLAVLGTVALPSLPLDFYLGATSDYSSDAHVDLVWHNPVTGKRSPPPRPGWPRTLRPHHGRYLGPAGHGASSRFVGPEVEGRCSAQTGT